MPGTTGGPSPKVCAVSYLNTSPLVWGMLRGPQKDLFDLFFRVPSACADMLSAGEADIGIVPAFELLQQNLEILPGLGIASRGAVRSILLVSKVEPGAIRTLAADSSSRTSVQLARVILSRKFAARPALLSHPPDLEAMLGSADAALIIGDPALRVDSNALPYPVLDLGREWTELTGLPMVFAVWAGRPGAVTPAVTEAFHASFQYGRAHMDALVAIESAARGFAPDVVRRYLTENIVHELGDAEREGMRRFLEWAALERSQSA